eukprot:CAMPEP_0197027958 /NCGR_PEP_ID=MMETSP1384-20130603/7797_1 /TAXON_ID=29189 /ORGANISM="Ammonia sp." /LENGTH=963 /DNA_ID=CAMNT_0042456887 /DNA_START=35 /DNA_END=2923 /DNA_ORIENTATION=+
MATSKIFDTVCGFPEELLLSETPMVCELLLKSPGPISHQHQSVKKWMNSLTQMLQNALSASHANDNHAQDDDEEDVDIVHTGELYPPSSSTHNDDKTDAAEEDFFISFDTESNQAKTAKHTKKDKNKDNEKNARNQKTPQDIDVDAFWSSLCLLATSYRVITTGHPQCNKQCNLILDALENARIFYNPILRTRCLETLCELMEYSRCTHDANAYQLSLQFSAKLIKFLQSILIDIVLNKNDAFNAGGRLLQTVLMMLYRLLANGKNLNAKSNISMISKACFHCLLSTDYKIRSTAIGILLLVCNNDKKYNQLMDKTMHTLHYLLRDLFPANMIVSYEAHHGNTSQHNIDPSKCIEEILELIPNRFDIDSFHRVSIFHNILNGLLFLLSHLLRRKHSKSLDALNTSSAQSVQADNKHSTAQNKKDNTVRIVSASCAMNGFHINLPLKSMLAFIVDVTSISINESIKYGNLIECTALLSELYQNALWLLVNVISTLQKSVLPYSGVIRRVLISVANETKYLKTSIDYEIRSSLYQCIKQIVPILGPCTYDILYSDLKIHLVNDLKTAQKLLMTSPPNPASLHQKSQQKLITSSTSSKRKRKNGQSPRKKQKVSHNASQTVEIDDSEKGLYLQREYDSKLSFYGNVLQCISTLFETCSNYMSLEEKSEMELILSASILGCYSDGGHILINLCLIDLFNEFVSTMVHVLMSPNVYKKPYLSLASKLLSSSFGVGAILGNHELLSHSQHGLRYIESVINPRSIPVYNKPLKLLKSDKEQVNEVSLRSVDEWNHQMVVEIMKKIKDGQAGDADDDEKDSEDMDEAEEEEEDIAMNTKQRVDVKTSMAERLLNRKRTFSEMEHNEEDEVAVNGFTVESDDIENEEEEEDAEQDDKEEDDNYDMAIVDNTGDDSDADEEEMEEQQAVEEEEDDDDEADEDNFDVAIESMMKEYAQHSKGEFKDDQDIKPLW